MTATPWRTPFSVVLVLLLISLSAASCGTATSRAADAPKARQMLIQTEQLPRQYRLANGQDYPGELTVCGVLLEPRGVHDFANRRFAGTFAGPFLDQYVFVTDGTEAGADLVHAVGRALRSCREPTITDGEGETMRVELTRLKELPEYGSASVGFRIATQGKRRVAEYLIVQREQVVFLLFTVALAQPPPRELLTSGAEAAVDQMPESR